MHLWKVRTPIFFPSAVMRGQFPWSDAVPRARPRAVERALRASRNAGAVEALNCGWERCTDRIIAGLPPTSVLSRLTESPEQGTGLAPQSFAGQRRERKIGSRAMSASGLDVFDRTLETTHVWLNEICNDLGPDKQVA